MPSNLAIDYRLLEEALRIGGKKTKRETVNLALYEFIQHRKQSEISGLFGKVDYDPKYHYKSGRHRN